MSTCAPESVILVGFGGVYEMRFCLFVYIHQFRRNARLTSDENTI